MRIQYNLSKYIKINNIITHKNKSTRKKKKYQVWGRRNRFGETFFSAQALTEEEEEIDLGFWATIDFEKTNWRRF